mmetsp:Transcript_12821/g.14725  ORF Transcript_12821/g.14725 Transcript_12821/m.14725 type:complete len:114 (+) Transcript_12821:28-369(+)
MCHVIMTAYKIVAVNVFNTLVHDKSCNFIRCTFSPSHPQSFLSTNKIPFFAMNPSLALPLCTTSVYTCHKLLFTIVMAPLGKKSSRYNSFLAQDNVLYAHSHLMAFFTHVFLA